MLLATVAAHILSQAGGSLLGACGPPAVTLVCVCSAAAGNPCVRPLRAACLMSAVVPLAALDQARVWRYQSIVPSIVSPWVGLHASVAGWGLLT